MKETDHYWAKDNGELLLRHCLHVSCIAKKICSNLAFSNDLRQKISASLVEIGALHDIGKAVPGFQKMLKEDVLWPHRHEIVSALVATQIAPQLTAEELFAIITHHKNIPAAVNGTSYKNCLPDNELPFLKPNVVDSIAYELKADSQNFIQFLKDLKESEEFDWKIKKLTFDFKDIGPLKQYWFRQQTKGQKDKVDHKARRYASLLRGLLITSDHLASAGEWVIPDVPALKDYTPTVLSKELKGKDILPFQELCSKVNGSAILKAPTGSGKTLAMLLWAANNQVPNGRFFYTLPYTASINAMYKRLSAMFPEKSVGVLHHRNAAFLLQLLKEEHCSTSEVNAKNLARLAEKLYHPFKVLTPHQILRVALRGKGWELGLVEFQNACFIFDEIHAFEPLIVGLIVATAKWLKSMGAMMLFASATMPKFIERILTEQLTISELNIIEPNPLSKKDNHICNKIRHQIKVAQGDLLSNCKNIIESIKKNPEQKILILCNYVATSQEICRKLENEKIDFMLLHARFNSKDRFRIEQQITSETPPKVLVSTQAIEVSLDIDYDCGYTEPAPIDALAQRFGRINRKGERPPASITVFEEETIKNGKIYDSETVKRTVELLKTKDVLSEQDLVTILNEVYKDGYTGESLKKYELGLSHQTINKFDENIIAGSYISWIEKLIEKTDGLVEILPFKGTDEKGNEICFYDEFEGLKREHKYIEANMLLVPVRMIQFMIAKKKGLIRKDKNGEWVTELQYSTNLGLDIRKQYDTIY